MPSLNADTGNHTTHTHTHTHMQHTHTHTQPAGFTQHTHTSYTLHMSRAFCMDARSTDTTVLCTHMTHTTHTHTHTLPVTTHCTPSHCKHALPRTRHVTTHHTHTHTDTHTQVATA